MVPDRIIDMIRSKLLPIDAIKLPIIDEADEMLSLGFENGLKQYYIALQDPIWKFDTITEIYENLNIGQTIISCNTKREVDELAYFMKKKII